MVLIKKTKTATVYLVKTYCGSLTIFKYKTNFVARLSTTRQSLPNFHSCRSSRPEEFCNFIRKRLQHRCFVVNIAEFFKNTFFCRTPANCRSSHRRYSMKKGVLKNFAIFTRRHLCKSLFLIKLQAFRPSGCFCSLHFPMPQKNLIKLSKPKRTQNLVKHLIWSFLRHPVAKYLFKNN